MDQSPSSPDVPLIHTALVVDDAGVVRRLSFRVLSEAGYRVFEAAGAVEAIEVLAMLRGKVDLVLVDVIMPDVKHCGGMLELTHIAAMADAAGCAVSPHNPSGPVSTAASVQVCAGMKNFRILEMQWGEVEWRGELLTPHEQFRQGAIRVPETPGFGARLNDKLVRAHLL